MGTFALDYRPVRFKDVVGQHPVKAVLKAMVRSGSLPPALIFGGTRGTGKTTSARILAAALNCEKPDDGDACGMCPSCKSVQQTNSLSVLEVDAASNGGVEEVRRIRDMCAYAHEGAWRVVLLDEAHSMSREAFNALLKLLEEPPEGTLFVLLTTEVHKILETVRSRAMTFEFKRITPADIQSRLQLIAEQEQLSAQPDLLQVVAARSQGGMRDAVMLLDQTSRVGVTDAAGFRELFGYVEIAIPLLNAAVDGDYATGAKLIEELFQRTGDAGILTSDLVLLVRDVIAIKAGAELPELQPDAYQARVALAEKIPQHKLSAAIKVLWDLKSRTRATEDDQLATMHMAFVLLIEAFHPATQPSAGSVPTLPPPPPKQLTLAEMAELAKRRSG